MFAGLQDQDGVKAKRLGGEHGAPTKYHITRYIHRRTATRQWKVHQDVINTPDTAKPVKLWNHHTQIPITVKLIKIQ